MEGKSKLFTYLPARTWCYSPCGLVAQSSLMIWLQISNKKALLASRKTQYLGPARIVDSRRRCPCLETAWRGCDDFAMFIITVIWSVIRPIKWQCTREGWLMINPTPLAFFIQWTLFEGTILGLLYEIAWFTVLRRKRELEQFRYKKWA